MIPILFMIGAIVLIALLTLRTFLKFSKDGLTNKEWYMLIGMVAVLVVSVLLVFYSFTVVDVGHAVIVVDPVSNTLTGPHLGAKWFFRAPWSYTVDIYYAMTSTEMWTDQEAVPPEPRSGEFPAIHVLSRDGLDIEVDILIRYQLDPDSLIALYRSFPDLKWEERAISSIVREDVRDVVSQYLALEIIEERESISTNMRETIFDSLISEPSLKRGLLESSIEIDLRDIDPPLKFKEAIEAKLTAEQQKLQAEFERERIVVLADAEAQRKIKDAYGESQAKIMIAEGTSEAIRIVQEQVGAEGWELYYSLQMLKEISPNVKVLIVTTGEEGVPIIYTLPGT